MGIQLLLGSSLLLCSILFSAVFALIMEMTFLWGHKWLLKEPHRPKLILVISAVSVWALAVLTIAVWLWAFAFLALGAFATLEEAVYFSLVTFTTLGFGDVLLPKEWRLLAGLASANGLLNFGLLTAVLVEALRTVRLGQVEVNRKRIERHSGGADQKH